MKTYVPVQFKYGMRVATKPVQVALGAVIRLPAGVTPKISDDRYDALVSVDGKYIKVFAR